MEARKGLTPRASPLSPSPPFLTSESVGRAISRKAGIRWAARYVRWPVIDEAGIKARSWRGIHHARAPPRPLPHRYAGLDDLGIITRDSEYGIGRCSDVLPGEGRRAHYRARGHTGSWQFTEITLTIRERAGQRTTMAVAGHWGISFAAERTERVVLCAARAWAIMVEKGIP
jgi:hypothetical protein